MKFYEFILFKKNLKIYYMKNRLYIKYKYLILLIKYINQNYIKTIK